MAGCPDILTANCKHVLLFRSESAWRLTQEEDGSAGPAADSGRRKIASQPGANLGSSVRAVTSKQVQKKKKKTPKK